MLAVSLFQECKSASCNGHSRTCRLSATRRRQRVRKVRHVVHVCCCVKGRWMSVRVLSQARSEDQDTLRAENLIPLCGCEWGMPELRGAAEDRSQGLRGSLKQQADHDKQEKTRCLRP